MFSTKRPCLAHEATTTVTKLDHLLPNTLLAMPNAPCAQSNAACYAAANAAAARWHQGASTQCQQADLCAQLPPAYTPQKTQTCHACGRCQQILNLQ